MGGWDGTGLPHRLGWTYGGMSSSLGPLSPTSACQVGCGISHLMGQMNPYPHGVHIQKY